MSKTRISLKSREAWAGRMFVLPFYIGVVFFFIKPLLQSFYFMFSEVSLELGGFNTDFIGLKNIKHIFVEDERFVPQLTTSLTEMVYQVPLIVLFSLFVGIILNQKFKGRTITRAIFFLPVIISTGVVTQILKADVFGSSLMQGAAGSLFHSVGIQEILSQISILSPGVIDFFTSASNNIFELMWKSGIQILLFVASLQTIPPPLYEASSIEGATAWENFWKITIPMVSPVILVNVIYTIIDSFTDYGNGVMFLISRVSAQMDFGTAAAMSWLYFMIVFLIISIITLVMSKWIFYTVE